MISRSRQATAQGWAAHHNADAWCWTAPVDGNPKWANWPMAGVWMCRHLWDHFAFTGDRDYLGEVWPALRCAAKRVPPSSTSSTRSSMTWPQPGLRARGGITVPASR